MIYRHFRAETLASFIMIAIELQVLFSAGESIFFAKQDAGYDCGTAAGDFSERKRKIDRTTKRN